MARQTRSDCTVGTFEKKNGLPPGTIRGKALTAQSPSGSPRRPRCIGEADVPRKPPTNCRGLDL